MNKKVVVVLIFVIIILVYISFNLLNKTTSSSSEKPSLELTIYTLSEVDTEKWKKLKVFETKDALYQLRVVNKNSPEEVFEQLVNDGSTSVGFGIKEEKVKEYNQNITDSTSDLKNNILLGIDFFSLSTKEEGVCIADYDYGSEELNSQKEKVKELYKKLYASSSFK